MTSLENKRAEIYALIDTDTDEIRYIGKANDSSKRLATHIRDSRRGSTPVRCWIKALQASGKTPDLVVIDEVAHEQWPASERYWIARGRSGGHRLLNLADGGDQPTPTSEQRREQARESTARRQERHARDPGAKAVYVYKREIGRRLAEFKRGGMLSEFYRLLFRVRIHGAVNKDISAWATKYR